ncbi:MAG: ribonuclease HI [Verrucomicrobiae bacterium]|nr:ribonuclease HI [Verrucomicrobiae bacterium]
MKLVHIYTDGSSRGNPGPGGYGTVVRYGAHLRELAQGFVKTTNNRMEILSAIAGLEILKEPCQVKIHSDSRYLVDAQSKGWISKWKQQGWRKADKSAVKNVDLWMRLERAAAPHRVEWIWVKGHDGHEMNERCDLLATEAADGKRGGLVVDEGFQE